MSAPSCIVIDTCVWADVYIDSRAGHDDAISLLSTAIESETPLAYAITSCKDLFYLIRAFQKRAIITEKGVLPPADSEAIDAIANGCIQNMRLLATAVALDESDVWIAEKLASVHPDFEDNFVIAAAMRAKAKFIVTTDKNLIAHSPVAALDPATARALIESKV